MGENQMPATAAKDGSILVKTIEHYTFADSGSIATIYIDLEKDLFEGAASLLEESQIEVFTRESELEVWLRRVPAFHADGALADWRLHLRPLFHSVEPEGTVKTTQGQGFY